MKLFSVEEANELLPEVRRIVAAISRAHVRVAAAREGSRLAAEGAQSGGGFMPGGAGYVRALMRLAESVGELETLGVQLKDYERGLIDFPAMRDGRVVLLCWQLGEGDRIEWWHDVDAGFAGRQPL
ncbi:MAG: DUF2203 domain-containing protein [Acidobacteria bacterium]|nr:DUF2203 domain-containing protein [Acidobacteriota bacterium]MCA1641030.1 DUF2203 domain-containing protein [Acidobacteriota bacterium]